MSATSTLSNTQFRPRAIQSANVGYAHRLFVVPKLTTRSGSIGIKRNARSGTKYHQAGSLL